MPIKSMDELIKALQKARLNNDVELEKELVKNLTPRQSVGVYGKALGQTLGQNYDLLDPKTGKPIEKKLINLFENPKKLEEIELVKDPEVLSKLFKKNPDYAGLYANNKIHVDPRLSIEDQLSVLAHEYGHGQDQKMFPKDFSKSFVADERVRNLQGTKKLLDMKGLEDTENLLEEHHLTPSFFEKYGLDQIKKNKKFQLLLPMLKAAGIAGVAAKAAGIGEKALAGEFPEAAKEAASWGLDEGTDKIPYVGQAKMALSSEQLGGDPESKAVEDPESNEFKSRLSALQRLKQQNKE
jgi:hypothetical protein